ncbi:apolipoprotein N-acyltransferase [Marinospirillum insulare]|uniref:Apolipoprotein N-acyltransferase n=1 Tax=Marinospirillum insulare TaxID=217169 RepID=A0ABQ5ZYT8_9GAMM|nr:apolipoprotein N-acyltransferase [Marinospirillum insulare]GLR64182.1 apolipoprotein N-acyltransferase [Marinospirillum insulare]
MLKIFKSSLAGHFFALIAGGSLSLAFAPFNLWLVSFFVPVIFWLLLKNLTSKQAILRGWLFGLGVFGAGASWVYVSIHEHSGTPTFIAITLTWAFVAGLACLFALQAWLWTRWLDKTNPLVSWPALWVLMEALRSWLFTGFPWLLLGTAHLETPYSGWAPVMGVYGLTAISVLSGMLIYTCFKPTLGHWQRGLSFSLFITLLLGGVYLQEKQWTHAYGSPITLGLVQGNIAQEDKWQASKQNEIIQNYLSLSYELGEVDQLIWPETALPLLPHQAEPYLNLALKEAGENAGLISGLISLSPSQKNYQNSLYTAGESKGNYHKIKLVPFGEFLPFEAQLRGLIDFFDLPMSSFVPGEEHPAKLTAGKTQVAPLICYEVAYPDFSAKQALNTQWLLTVSNDAWFGRSLGPLQHFEMARFRALETARPMARVTNNGITALIDHQGQVIKKLPQFVTATLKGELQPREGNTPFMLTGSLPLWIFCLLLIEWQRYLLYRKTSKRKHKYI